MGRMGGGVPGSYRGGTGTEIGIGAIEANEAKRLRMSSMRQSGR